MRRVVAIAVLLAVLFGANILEARAQSVGSEGTATEGAPAEAQRRTYSINLGRNSTAKWHAEGEGNIIFYDGYRHFRVSGNLNYHHSVTDGSTGYPQVRQNIANTSVDGGWIRFSEDSCDVDTSVPGTDYACDVYARNHYFENSTEPGHGLAGVWIRFCKEQSGPDLCGRYSQVSYADNPYQ